MKNTKFINKRHWLGDFSVDFSDYLFMNSSQYDQYVLIQELNYTGMSVPPQNHTIPENPSYSWIQNKQLEESVSSSLGVIADIDFSRKVNYYVIYGAIDLMNYHYTSKDPSGKVVCCFLLYINCSGDFLPRNSFIISPAKNRMTFVLSWIIFSVKVFVKSKPIEKISVLIR